MIEVLCGMIASGKSTYARQRAKEGAIIISDDAIVQAVHGGDYTLYSPKLKTLYKSIENHILHMAITADRDVVIDRGLDVNDKSRERWIAMANSLDETIYAVVFKKERPEIHAKRRFESDGRGYNYNQWLGVATTHANYFVYPNTHEGFDRVVSYEDLRDSTKINNFHD